MRKFFVLITIIILVLSGCNNVSDNNIGITEKPQESDDNHVSDNNANCIELEIYQYSDEDGCIPTTSLIPEDVTIDARLIINEVNANFDEKVAVTDVEEKDDYVAVYFDSDSAPLIGVSAYTEEAMLDCISYSLIDNLDKCNKIYFRTNKGKYKSDDIELEYDEPYITR